MPEYCPGIPSTGYSLQVVPQPPDGCQAAVPSLNWVNLTSMQDPKDFHLSGLIKQDGHFCVFARITGFVNTMAFASNTDHVVTVRLPGMSVFCFHAAWWPQRAQALTRTAQFLPLPLASPHFSTSEPILADSILPSAGALLQCAEDKWPCTVPSKFTCSDQCLYFSWGTVHGGISGVSTVSLSIFTLGTGGRVSMLSQAIQDFTKTSFSVCGLTLNRGTQLEAELVVTNKAGTAGSVATSVLVDGTAPTAEGPAVVNGYEMGVHGKFWNRSDIAVATLAAFEDLESGMAPYALHLQRSVVLQEGSAYKTVASVTVTERDRKAYDSRITLVGLSLECGGVYRWQLDVSNLAGCDVRQFVSEDFIVDSLQVHGR